MGRALAAALFVPAIDTYRTACQLLFRSKRGETQVGGCWVRSRQWQVVIAPSCNAG
jgi:hypothetical protein